MGQTPVDFNPFIFGERGMNGNWTSLIGRASLGGMQLAWLALSVLVLNRRLAGDSLPWVTMLLFYPLSATVNLFRRSRIRVGNSFFLLNGSAIFWPLRFCWGSDFWLPRVRGPNPWLALVARFFNPDQVEFLIFVSSAISWGLGCRLAFLKISFSALFSEFQFGLALLFIALFAEHRLQMNLPHLIPLILLFFSFALVGVGVTHGR